MIFGLMLDSNEEEERTIYQYVRELIAYYTDERLEIKVFQRNTPFLQQLEKTELLDMALVDVTLPGALDSVRLIRKKFPKTEILVIADLSVSPMKYMQPSIRASSLLLRPMSSEWKDAIREFFGQLLKDKTEKNKDEILWIKNQQGSFRIPLNQVCYLEAREKKVFIRTKLEEFGISETIEKIMERLPQNFVRCHRSYIVNEEFITRIKLTENLLYLGNTMFVPVSRSYKGIFKRHLNE